MISTKYTFPWKLVIGNPDLIIYDWGATEATEIVSCPLPGDQNTQDWRFPKDQKLYFVMISKKKYFFAFELSVARLQLFVWEFSYFATTKIIKNLQTKKF